MDGSSAANWAAGLSELVEDRPTLARLAAQWFAPERSRPVDTAGAGAGGRPAGASGGHRPPGAQSLDTLAGVPRSVAEELSAIWLLLRTISLTDFGSLDPPLTSREFAALHLLQTTGPLRVIDVGELLRMDKSTTSRVVRALLDRGLLDRTRHPTDGRAFLVRLAEDGRRVVEDAVTARESTLVAVLSRWDELARSALLEALLRLRREWSSVMPQRWQGESSAPVDD